MVSHPSGEDGLRVTLNAPRLPLQGSARPEKPLIGIVPIDVEIGGAALLALSR